MQTNQPKISEILHYAADNCLWNGKDDESLFYRNYYSCHAIRDAVYRFGAKSSTHQSIHDGLGNMGLDTESLGAFLEFPAGQKRQGARYAWLKFAAMIAEEQGV